METTKKTTKIEIAIANIKSDKARVEREIMLLQREQERLFNTLNMLENLEADKHLA